MIALAPTTYALLLAVIDAGERGYAPVEAELVQLAGLALDGLVSIQTVNPRLAFATERGRAFAMRTAA